MAFNISKSAGVSGLVALIAIVAGCTGGRVDRGTAAETPSVCAAFKGNGAKVLATTNALARMIENVGPMDGVEGASSGSVLAFFYDSFMTNPVIKDCGGVACDRQALGSRVSLGLKSFQGYVDSLQHLPEGMAIQELATDFAGLQKDLKKLLDLKKDAEIVKQARIVLRSERVRALLNPELLRAIRPANILKAKAEVARLRQAIDMGSVFSGKDDQVLYRDGLLNIDGLIGLLGRAADFYADIGQKQDADWRKFFDSCSAGVKGREWHAIRDDRPAGLGGGSCGELLLSMIQQRRRTDPTTPSRMLESNVGSSVPAVVSTSVLVGPDVTRQFTQAREDFKRFRPVRFRPGFDAFRLGYFGDESSLARIFRGSPDSRDSRDLGASRRFRLGTLPWKLALRHSISEPGLSHVLPMENATDLFTAGGWAHFDHARALKAMGCQTAIYITHKGTESPFCLQTARRIGASEDEILALYSLDRDAPVESAAARNLKEADAVVCTNWEGFGDGQLAALISDALSAPIEVRSEVLRKGDLTTAPADIGVRGCSASLPSP